MTNQIYVRRVVFAVGNHLAHYRVPFLVRAFSWNQIQSPCNSEDMNVHRKEWPLARKKQNTTYRFGADAVEFRQEIHCLVHWTVMQERQIEIAALLMDLIENSFDAE